MTDYVAYRLTTDEPFEFIESFFAGYDTVMAHEVSATGVSHYHVVMLWPEQNMPQYKKVANRLDAHHWGPSKRWSRKNHMSDVHKAISYTIKDGDWRVTGHFPADLYGEVPEWIHGGTDEQAENEEDDCKMDKTRNWPLTYNNLIPQALRFRAKTHLTTDNLGAVLSVMTEQTNWRPSIDVLRRGLDPLHFRMFAWECNRARTFEKPPDWWTPRIPEELFKGAITYH